MQVKYCICLKVLTAYIIKVLYYSAERIDSIYAYLILMFYMKCIYVYIHTALLMIILHIRGIFAYIIQIFIQ